TGSNYSSNGTVHLSWTGLYIASISEHKNGVFQRNISPPEPINYYQITGRSDAIWTYHVSGEPTVGGGGGCIPYCPFAAIWEKLNNNPLFFLVASAHAFQNIGSLEVEVLNRPGVPGSITLAASNTTGTYSIGWGAATGGV